MKLFYKSFLVLTAVFSAIIFQGCNDNNNSLFQINYDPPPAFDTSAAVNDTTFANGLQVYTITKGSGKSQVVPNDAIQIRYTGRREGDGKVFGSSYYENSPRTSMTLTDLTPSNLNSRSPASIKGFRLGIIGMKKGEKRAIVVPPALGTSSINGHDLRGKTLIFNVELVSIL